MRTADSEELHNAVERAADEVWLALVKYAKARWDYGAHWDAVSEEDEVSTHHQHRVPLHELCGA